MTNVWDNMATEVESLIAEREKRARLKLLRDIAALIVRTEQTNLKDTLLDWIEGEVAK